MNMRGSFSSSHVLEKRGGTGNALSQGKLVSEAPITSNDLLGALRRPKRLSLAKTRASAGQREDNAGH